MANVNTEPTASIIASDFQVTGCHWNQTDAVNHQAT